LTRIQRADGVSDSPEPIPGPPASRHVSHLCASPRYVLISQQMENIIISGIFLCDRINADKGRSVVRLAFGATIRGSPGGSVGGEEFLGSRKSGDRAMERCVKNHSGPVEKGNWDRMGLITRCFGHILWGMELHDLPKFAPQGYVLS
jgi:hypothetical protein